VNVIALISIVVAGLAIAVTFAAYIWAAREDGRYQKRVNRVQQRLKR
jgi:hypothetical protein